MFKKAIAITVFLAVLFFSITQDQVQAGVPTLDYTAVTQRIMSYMQEFKKYQEMINQSTKMTQQYIQLVKTYQQKLREYNHYLNQIKSLKSRIDNKDWLAILRFIEKNGYYGRSRLAQVQAMDPDDSDYHEKLDEALGDYGYLPRRPEEVEADAAAVGVWSEQLGTNAKRNWNNYDLLKQRMAVVSKNENDNKAFNKKLTFHQKTADALGDEDDLATQQAGVKQGITMMEQNNAIRTTLNQILFNMQQESAREASIKAEEIDSELDRLKKRVPSQGLGRSTILP